MTNAAATPYSLRRRMLALVLGVLVVVWAGAAAMTWWEVRHELDELLDAHLTQAASLLVAQNSPHGDGDDDDDADAPTLHRYAPRVSFQVYSGGVLQLSSANAPHAPMVKSTNPTTRLAEGFYSAEFDNKTWRVFFTRGTHKDMEIYVGEDATSRTHILWAILRSTLLPMAIALPLLALMLWGVIHQSMAPIERLRGALVLRRSDALEPIDAGNTPLEITPMVAALNDLFVRIAGLLESERRFTADASHELRTPIAAIRAQAQVALAATELGERRNALLNTLAGCDRASHLVEQLLTLSRLDGSNTPERVDIDICAMLRQGVADLAPKWLEKNQNVELDAPRSCTVRANSALFGIMVRNLLDNAVRYSPECAQILICIRQAEGTFELVVQDSGPGMSEADLARLGERFFRVNGHLEAGSGLGWSIVRRIASVHQLEVVLARSEKLGGLRVTVSGKKCL